MVNSIAPDFGIASRDEGFSKSNVKYILNVHSSIKTVLDSHGIHYESWPI